MTFDPIFIVSSIITLLILVGLYILACYIDRLTARLDIQEAEIRQLWEERRILIDGLCDAGISITTNATAIARISGDLAKISDALSDLRGEYLAQARALDAHNDRLSVLKGEQ